MDILATKMPIAVRVGASSTAILDLNDDCLYYICKMLSFKDQLQLVNTCKRFRLIVRQMIWRKQFQKIRISDSDTNELSDQEYQQFFHHIVEYLEEFTIADNDSLVSISDLSLNCYEPDLTFYLCSHFPRLTRLECLDDRLHDGLMRMIAQNCPQLKILMVSSDNVTGAHIKDMSNLHELYLPGCSLCSDHLSDIFMHLKITHLDVSENYINLPIDVQTWKDLRFLKMSENDIDANFVEKCSYLRALNCLTVTQLTTKARYILRYTALFKSIGSIITAMNLYYLRGTRVMTLIAKNTNQLTALKRIFCVILSIKDLRDFPIFPALKEFYLYISVYEPEVGNIIRFITKSKNLEYFELVYCGKSFNINFDWLLDVIQILRQQKGRPKLYLNLAFTDNRFNMPWDEIKRLVMTEQNDVSQPLLEVTFNMPAVYSFTLDPTIKFYFNRM